jgi:fructokinase
VTVVVCGEALVDLLPVGTDPLTPLAPTLGGGPLNVAVTLGRLGVPTHFCSRVSTDGFGDALLAHLTAAGVSTELVQRGAEPTTLAVVALSPEGSARYSFYVEGTADRLVTDPGPFADDVTAVSLGTLSLVLEPGASVYETVLHREHAAGRVTVLDPNIRAELITNPDAYRARFRTWLPSVDILKLSDDDAEWLGGTPTEWVTAGVSAVVLTHGNAGLAVHTPRGVIDVEAPSVTVADTIGAGDTVHGALIASLHRDDALTQDAVRNLDNTRWRRALKLAAAAAAITVSRPGADPPWTPEMD